MMYLFITDIQFLTSQTFYHLFGLEFWRHPFTAEDHTDQLEHFLYIAKESYSKLSRPAHPDFAELDVFLGQHSWPWNNILIQKCNLDHFPTAKPNLNHE